MSELLNSMRIDDSMVIRHLNAVNDQDALDKMANLLLSKGIVKERFLFYMPLSFFVGKGKRIERSKLPLQ